MRSGTGASAARSTPTAWWVCHFQVCDTGYWRLRPRNDTDDKARPAGALSPFPHGGEGRKITDVVPDVDQGRGLIVDQAPDGAGLVDARDADLQYLRTGTHLHAVLPSQVADRLAQAAQHSVGVVRQAGMDHERQSLVLDPDLGVGNEPCHQWRQVDAQRQDAVRCLLGGEVAVVPALRAVQALDHDPRDLGQPADLHGRRGGPAGDDGDPCAGTRETAELVEDRLVRDGVCGMRADGSHGPVEVDGDDGLRHDSGDLPQDVRGLQRAHAHRCRIIGR